VEGDRLVRIGKDVSTIFDLKAHTVSVVQLKEHAYSVETLDEAQQRLAEMLGEWRPPIGTTGKFTIEVQKTSQTRQMQGQTAEEYRVIAITLYQGRRVVAGSSITGWWPKPPLDELAAFKLRWSRECDLPFPGMPPAGGDPSVFGAMAGAASKLTGYPILYVVESDRCSFPVWKESMLPRSTTPPATPFRTCNQPTGTRVARRLTLPKRHSPGLFPVPSTPRHSRCQPATEEKEQRVPA